MDFYLVRHGEAAASWGESSDPGLSDLGWKEARDAAETLKSILGNETLLLSSPLLRAQETAAPLAAARQQDVVIESVFREIPSPVPLAQRQAWLRQFMQQHWAEQGEELTAWRSAALRRLLALTHPAVIFTHFLVINAVVGQILERPETLCFWPANGSITHLRHNGTELELISLGEEVETIVN